MTTQQRLTESELDAVQRLCDEATPGEWATWFEDAEDCQMIGMAEASDPDAGHWEPQHRIEYAEGLYPEDGHQYVEAVANAAFIVGARSALPRLLEELRAWRDTAFSQEPK